MTAKRPLVIQFLARLKYFPSRRPRTDWAIFRKTRRLTVRVLDHVRPDHRVFMAGWVVMARFGVMQYANGARDRLQTHVALILHTNIKLVLTLR